MGQNGTGIAIFGQFWLISDTRQQEFGTQWDNMGRQWEIPVPRRAEVIILEQATARAIGPGFRHSRAGGNPEDQALVGPVR